MAKERRLTPTAQKKLFLQKYTLSTDQLEELNDLFTLAKSGEDEAAVAALITPLAEALQKLREQNVLLHRPLFKLFDRLVSSS